MVCLSLFDISSIHSCTDVFAVVVFKDFFKGVKKERRFMEVFKMCFELMTWVY